MPRTNKKSHKRRSNKNKAPRLFGLGWQDAVLVCLAVNGPMYASEIARTLGITADSALDAVQHLVDIGLSVKGQRVGVGGIKPVALNRALPIYHQLWRLLLVMDRHWPVPRAESAGPSRRQIPYNTAVRDWLFQQIFISSIRTRVLLYIATSQKATLSAISHALKAHRMSVLSAVNLWESEGVIRSQYIEGARVLSLDPGFPVALELQILIRTLISSESSADG